MCFNRLKDLLMDSELGFAPTTLCSSAGTFCTGNLGSKPRGRRDHAARGVGALAVEDGLPGGAGVHRLPHSARRHRHVVDVALLRVHRDVADAAGLDRGTDVPEGEPLEGGRGHRVLRLVGGVRGAEFS